MTSILRSCMSTISSCPVISCLGASGLVSGGVGGFLSYLALKAYRVYQECCHTDSQPGATLCPSITPVSQHDFCEHTKSHGYGYLTGGAIAVGAGFVLFCVAGVCCCCVRDCIPEKEKDVEAKGERVPLNRLRKKTAKK